MMNRKCSLVTIVMLFAIGLCLYGISFAGNDYDPTTFVYPTRSHAPVHRATPVHLKMYLGNSTKFNDPQGLACAKLKFNDNPNKKSDDDELTVYGVNSGECEIIYNTSMTTLAIYGSPGSGEGQFNLPRGIACDENGNVIVADTGNDRIVILKNDNNRLTFVKNVGVRGEKEGEFKSPRQVALSPNGEIFVTDTGNHRVQVFSLDGKFLRTFGSQGTESGKFESPDGIAVTSKEEQWSFNPAEEFIIVVDSNNKRINKFTYKGEFVNSISAKEIGYNNAYFAYIAIDYYNNVYVTDTENCKIHKFDSSLHHITSFGRCGTNEKELDQPRGIAIWRRFGQTFVAEREGAQYFWIGTDISNLKAFNENNNVVIQYYLTEPSFVTIEIYDKNGRKIKTLISNEKKFAMTSKDVWNRKDDKGNLLPTGKYTAKITIEATYSSKRYFKKDVEINFE